LWANQAAAPPEPTQPAQPVARALAIVQVNDRDEYVDVQNMSGELVDFTGWHLLSERGAQDCALGGTIQPGEMLRIWARAEDLGNGGYNCGFGSNIWNNSEPDAAILYDPNGEEVARGD
jgi:hypothetical protein